MMHHDDVDNTPRPDSEVARSSRTTDRIAGGELIGGPSIRKFKLPHVSESEATFTSYRAVVERLDAAVEERDKLRQFLKQRDTELQEMRHMINRLRQSPVEAPLPASLVNLRKQYHRSLDLVGMPLRSEVQGRLDAICDAARSELQAFSDELSAAIRSTALGPITPILFNGPQEPGSSEERTQNAMINQREIKNS